jgi:hypothetical protein
MTATPIASTHVDAVLRDGWTVIPDFVTGERLREAQEALWLHYPRPSEYFTDPSRFPELQGSQFAGLHVGASRSWALNRLAIDDDLVDFAARVLGSDDLNLYKIELWAKYAGAASMGYDQHHHRDFGNHSIVVPQRANPVRQLTTFLLLSDVDESCGPTRVVPFDRGAHVPMWPNGLPMGDLFDDEVMITGSAGSLFAYRTDILHRGSEITRAGASRFTLLADFQVWGARWNAKLAWPHHAGTDGWREMLARATVRQRALFGFPEPDDAYWDEQTIHDVGLRYPDMDMTPYRLGR